jgi:RHS repeat-associated protein
VTAHAGVQNLFDRPFLLTPSRMILDAAAINQSFESLNGGNLLSPELISLRQAVGLTSSSLEHELWEELLLTPSVSTTKLLQLARSNGGVVQTITSANSATVLPQLQLPNSVATEVRADLARNRTILITSRMITLGAYRGYGWISEISSGLGAFLILGDSLATNPHGGDSGTGPYTPVGSNPGPAGDPIITNGTACFDPVTVSNGNMFHTAVDFAISSRGPGFMLSRTYNSLLSRTDGPFGFGWSFNLNLSVRESGSTITLTTGTGGSFAFTLQGASYRSATLPQVVLTKETQGYVLRHKNGSLVRFNATGKLTAIADRVNNSLQFTYDSNGRLSRVTDALNRSVTFTTNGQGRIVGAQDFTGRRTSYEYDSGGNLISATDFAGARTLYTYYNDTTFVHLLKSVTTRANKTSTFEYYANRKAARTVEPGGRTARYLYLPMRNETVVIDYRGFATSFFYNALGNVTRIIKPNGSFADRVYTPAAQLAAVTDEGGSTTRYQTDALGNITSITDAFGNTAQVTYEPRFNRIATARDPKGNVTTFEYDDKGNLTRVAGPLGREAKFTYNSFGQVLTATNAEGAVVSIVYDDAGNAVKLTDPLGNSSSIEYDNLRRPVRRKDAAGNERSVTYDVLGRVVRLVDPLGDAASMTYNADGVLTEFTDTAGRVTRYGRDGINNLSEVTDPAGSVTSYGFNIADCGCSASDNLVSYRDSEGRTSTYEYNSDNRIVSSSDSLGNVTRFTYDGRKNLVGLTNANGTAMAMEYDLNGRLIRRSFPDGGPETRFAYDNTRRLVSASNQHVTYTFSYDSRNRLSRVDDSRFNRSISYTYDKMGRRTTVTDGEGGVHTYAWDARNQLTSITSPSGARAQFRYDALSRTASLTYSNGVASAYSYDPRSRLTSLTHGEIGSFAYTYDKRSNPLTVSDASGTHAYQYDELNRLTTASHPSAPEESFRYDRTGNRLASAGDSGYSYDPAGRLLAAEGFTYKYDNHGNLVEKAGSEGVTAYVYSAENRLTEITFPDGSTVSYKYDPMGRRIEKNVNGVVTAYVYDGFNVLLELDGDGALQARYTHGPGIDQPLMMERAGGETYFYHSDRMGSIAALSGSSGAVVCTYQYDSFGKTQPCAKVANPYGFAGREYDAESGLYYLRARYYDPATGRFISPDPLDLTGLLLLGSTGLRGAPQRLNPYSYAVNNPLVFRDPSGLKDEETGCKKIVIPDIPYPPNVVGYAYPSGWFSDPIPIVVTDNDGKLAGPVRIFRDDMDMQWTVEYIGEDEVMKTNVTFPLSESDMALAMEARRREIRNLPPPMTGDEKFAQLYDYIWGLPEDAWVGCVDFGVWLGFFDKEYASDEFLEKNPGGYWYAAP